MQKNTACADKNEGISLETLNLIFASFGKLHHTLKIVTDPIVEIVKRYNVIVTEKFIRVVNDELHVGSEIIKIHGGKSLNILLLKILILESNKDNKITSYQTIDNFFHKNKKGSREKGRPQQERIWEAIRNLYRVYLPEFKGTNLIEIKKRGLKFNNPDHRIYPE